MTGSFRKIDYRLRPAKHAERHMLCDILRRLRFGSIESYRYVGFGSVAFVDFRLFHRTLGISDMISIEDAKTETEKERFNNNAPFGYVKLAFDPSQKALPKIDFAKPSIVWLDYDDKLSRSMAADLSTIAQTIANGSFVSVTFTTSYPTVPKDRAAELTRLKSDFPEFLTDHTKPQEFEKDGLSKFGKKALGALFERSLADADAGLPAKEQRKPRQVCFFRYRDGTWMTTVGWVIASDSRLEEFELCRFADLPFVRTGNDPFKIQVPLVTPFEIREMERKLPSMPPELEWIPEAERNAFLEMYRYLPHFAPLEPT